MTNSPDVQRRFAFERATIEKYAARSNFPSRVQLLVTALLLWGSQQPDGSDEIVADDGWWIMQPSRKELAKAVGCSVKTIQRALADQRAMIRDGLLEVDEDEDGARRNIYSLNVEELKRLPPVERRSPRLKRNRELVPPSVPPSVPLRRFARPEGPRRRFFVATQMRSLTSRSSGPRRILGAGCPSIGDRFPKCTIRHSLNNRSVSGGGQPFSKH